MRAIVDIVYPATCVVCKNRLQRKPSSIEKPICLECWGKIKRNMPPFCHSCGRQLAKNNLAKGICYNCIKKPLHFDRAFSPCVYEGVIQNLIHEFKYKNKDYLGLTLSRLMVEFIREYNMPIELMDFIIPIPLHKTRLREREFNQAQILSNHISAEFNKKAINNNLIRRRHTNTQTDLEDTQRFLNIKGSFSVDNKEAIKSKNILLVDDVLTTGATSSEAAYVLKEAGANIVFVLTLAN